MADPNPFKDSDSPQQVTHTPPAQEGLTGKDTYNVVADLVTGANVRTWDNSMQVVAILVCTPIGALIGYQMATLDRGFAATVGGFFGLLAGLFGSGIFLMFYRAVRHIRGKHD